MARARNLLARIAGIREVRRVREISETILTPRVRAELASQSAALNTIQSHLPLLLNKIQSSDGSARLLARRLEQQAADAESRYGSREELDALAAAVTDHAETQAWLIGRVEMIRAEMLYELRYGDRPAGEDQGRPEVEIVTPGALEPEGGEVRLNLGCGHKPIPGYANVDARRLPGVDVVAPIDELPVGPESVSEIFSAHVLEHFPDELLRRKLLPYWVALLRPGGVFRAVVPDMDAMARAYVDGDLDFDQLRSVTYGGQEYEGDAHYNGFTVARLTEVLAEAGLVDVQVVAQARPEGDCLELELTATRPA